MKTTPLLQVLLPVCPKNFKIHVKKECLESPFVIIPGRFSVCKTDIQECEGLSKAYLNWF